MMKKPRMKTALFQASKLSTLDYQKIGQRLFNGATCVVPTETVYGLAANGLDPTAIAKIYAAKGRPSDNPLILHIADSTMLKRIVTDISEDAKTLMDAFWPGPLTLIFKKATRVPYAVTGGLDSVAVRMPSHPVMHALIHAANTPLAAPSANLSGRPSATTLAHVKNDLFGRVDMIIDGGESMIGLESTVVDVSRENVEILRPGQIDQAMLEATLKKPVPYTQSTVDIPRSPGLKYGHYQPHGSVELILGDTPEIFEYLMRQTAPENTRVICPIEWAEHFSFLKVSPLGSIDDSASIMRDLYARLREMDDDDVEMIYLLARPDLNAALLDRMKKAANHHVTHLVESEDH